MGHEENQHSRALAGPIRTSKYGSYDGAEVYVSDLVSVIGDFSPATLHGEHNVRVTPKRAFWEAFATVCLPSLILWTIFVYWFLCRKLNLPYAEALPIYLFWPDLLGRSLFLFIVVF